MKLPNASPYPPSMLSSPGLGAGAAFELLPQKIRKLSIQTVKYEKMPEVQKKINIRNNLSIPKI